MNKVKKIILYNGNMSKISKLAMNKDRDIIGVEEPRAKAAGS